MAEARLKLNHAAIDRLLHSPRVDAAVLQMAVDARDRANDWANSQTRSGHHPVLSPHFRVVEEKGERRVRYTVRPATLYATWLVMHDPSGFIACLDAARS